MDPIRIWYQSFVDEPHGKMSLGPAAAPSASVVDPGTTVDVKGITPHGQLQRIRSSNSTAARAK